MTIDTIAAIAERFSRSGLMGKASPDAVFGLMMLCQSEGITPIAALKRYHIIEGKPSMRSDAMLAEFLHDGGRVIFHVRDDAMVGATFLSKTAPQAQETVDRASQRFIAVWKLMSAPEGHRTELYTAIAKLSHPGEETIVRTFADCQAKGLTDGNDGGLKKNWATSPRQMLTARVITEGIRLVAPQLVTGVYTPEEISDSSPLAGLTSSAPAKTASELRAAALDERDPEKRRALLGAASDIANQEQEPAAKEVKAELVLESDDIPMGDAANGKPAKEKPVVEEKRLQVGVAWQEYVITELKNKAMNGRKLGDMTRSEIEVLHKTRCAPFLKSDNDGLRLEAEKIKEAHESFVPYDQAETPKVGSGA